MYIIGTKHVEGLVLNQYKGVWSDSNLISWVPGRVEHFLTAASLLKDEWKTFNDHKSPGKTPLL